MKKTKVRVASLFLMLSLLLTGCGSLHNYFYTENGLKRVAEKALEEKYDEEFVIHDVWSRDSTIFYATCSPESDTDVVFEAQIYKDGSGLYKEEYLQEAVAKQLEEKLQPELEKIFEDCFVKVTFTFAEYKYDYYKGVTIEDYYELYGKEQLYLRIFVNTNREYQKDEALLEYECLSDLLSDEGIQEAGCRCYFVNELKMNECRSYFEKNSHLRGNLLQDVQYFGFGFDEGVINKTFEEYEEIRREINTNE